VIENLIKFLPSIVKFIAPKNLKKLKYNFKTRTDFISIIVSSDNELLSKIIETFDSFGFLNIYLIQKEDISNSIEENFKWLEFKKFEDYQECCERVREDGYKICFINSSNDSGNSEMGKFELKEKIAIFIDSKKNLENLFFKNKSDYILNLQTYGFIEELSDLSKYSIVFYEFRKKLELAGLCDSARPPKQKIFNNWIKFTKKEGR